MLSENCGVAANQASLRQGASWTIQAQEYPGERPDDPRLGSFNYDANAVVLEYGGLAATGDFRVRLIFYNVVHQRAVSITVNGVETAANLALPIGQCVVSVAELPQTAAADGRIRIVIRNADAHSAIVNAVEIESSGKQPANVHERLLAATGGRNVRAVWGRYPTGKRDEGAAVIGYDAATGTEHVIVPGPVGCVLPLITDDGERVIFSDIKRERAYIVNWDGSGSRVIGEGQQRFVAAYWRDPQTRVEWVYFGMPSWKKEGDPAIVRRRLDGTGPLETVWDKTSLGYMFGLSADGTRGGGELGGWPKQQVANLVDGSYTLYGKGCVGNMSPDNSYRYFYFEGNHVNIQMFDADRTNRRAINLNFPTNGAPGREAWPIRWASDVRFIGLSGPWASHNKWAPANVYIGQFNPELTAMSQWFQISNTPGTLDYEPYVWVAPGAATPTTRTTPTPEKPTAPASESTPAAQTAALSEGLLFHWQSGDWEEHPVLAYDADGTAKRDVFLDVDGQSHLGLFREMIVHAGSFRAPDMARYIATQVNKSQACTVAIVIRPDHWDRAGPRQVLGLVKGKVPSLALALHEDWLALKVQTRDRKASWIKLTQLTTHEQAHIAISLEEKQYHCYVNGQAVASGELSAPPGTWTATDVVVGDTPGSARPWQGEAECIPSTTAPCRPRRSPRSSSKPQPRSQGGSAPRN